jgi:hypothetical protein
MKKVILIVSGLFLVLYTVICIASYRNSNMPKQLVSLQQEFSSECERAEWNMDIGLTKKSAIGYRLKKTIEKRDSLLKDLSIRSFNVQWECTTNDHRGVPSHKPEPHFSGLYWR